MSLQRESEDKFRKKIVEILIGCWMMTPSAVFMILADDQRLLPSGFWCNHEGDMTLDVLESLLLIGEGA